VETYPITITNPFAQMSAASCIAFGPDGKAYVIEPFVGVIRMSLNPKNDQSVYSAFVPTGPSLLNDLAFDGAGNLYVTDSFAAAIYRIPAGGGANSGGPGLHRDSSPPEAAMLSVQQLLDRKPKAIYSVKPDDPVITAIQEMADHHIGALLVMSGDKLAGIVSERDYARKVVLLGRSSTETPVRDIMTTKVITVVGKQDINDCMRLMTDKRIRHLPVVAGERVIGVLSIGDLVRAVIEEQERTIADLETYIHG